MGRCRVGYRLAWAALCCGLWLGGSGRAVADGGSLQEDQGIWFGAFLESRLTRIHSPLFFYLDFQARFSKAGEGFSQALFRPAMGYVLPHGFSVLAGYAWFGNAQASDKPIQSEHRIWEQLNWKWKWKKAAFELYSRTRFEQRFISSGPGVQVRFRQYLRALCFFHPKSPVGLGIGDEIFVAFNPVPWSQQTGFTQNRLLAILAVQVHDFWRFEGGYMHQWFAATPAARVSHNLFFRFFISF